jgi:alpha-N-arabinofuranosidase
MYDTEKRRNIPYIDSTAVLSEEGTELAVFAVNRSLDSECKLGFSLSGFDGFKPAEHIALEGDDLKAVNTADKPDTVVPVTKDISDNITLAPHSWNMIILRKS